MMSLMLHMILLILTMMLGWVSDDCMENYNDTVNGDASDDNEKSGIDGDEDEDDATTESQNYIQSNININVSDEDSLWK